MSQLKKLAGETAIYGLSSIIGRMLNYLLVPFYTRVFMPGEYGIVTEMYAYAAFLNVIYTYGLETAYFRFAFKNREDEGKVFNAAQTSIIATSLLFSLVLILFAGPISAQLGYPGKSHFITWFAGILAIDAVVAIPFARLRLEKKPMQFAIAKLSNIGLNIGLNLFFLVFCREVYAQNILPGLKPLIDKLYFPNLGVEYVFLSNLLANAVLLALLWKAAGRFRFSFDWAYFKPMLVYAYPILFLGIAGTINEMLSRLTLKWWLPEGFYPGRSNLDALGIFGACYKLSIFMSLAIQAFRFAAEPFFFSKADDKNSPRVFADIMHYFIIACCLILVGVGINLDLIGIVFLQNAAYREALHVVPVLLLANLFLGVYYNLTAWFKLSDKTYYGTYISVGGAVITVAANFILIPLAGYEGSAYATLACYVSMTLACYYFGQKNYPIPYRVRAGLAYILVSALLVGAVNALPIDSFIISLAFHTLVLTGFMLGIFLAERKRLQGKVR